MGAHKRFFSHCLLTRARWKSSTDFDTKDNFEGLTNWKGTKYTIIGSSHFWFFWSTVPYLRCLLRTRERHQVKCAHLHQRVIIKVKYLRQWKSDSLTEINITLREIRIVRLPFTIRRTIYEPKIESICTDNNAHQLEWQLHARHGKKIKESLHGAQ